MNNNSNLGSADHVLAGLQIDLLQKIRNGSITTDQMFKFLNMSKSDREQMFGKPETSGVSFKVSDVFGSRIKGYIPQYLGGNYQNWIFSPNQHKTLIIPKTMSKLVEYKLPKNMNDTAIQNETQSIPMDEETFLVVLYLLIIKPELGKELLGYELKQDGTWYLFHVKMADGTVRAVRVNWYGGEWNCVADSFVGHGDWCAGGVFVRFATV